MHEKKESEIQSFNKIVFDNDLTFEELEERLEMSPWVCIGYCEEASGECNGAYCANCQGNV